MIIKYKDKEYNIEPNYQSLINLKNQCFNNHFHFIMKEVLKNEEFSKWFYSEYDSVGDFNSNPNKCLMCNTKTNGMYCKECRKTDEYKNIRVKKIKQTKLKRYGSENYNNAEKQKLTNSLKSDEEKTIIINKIKNKHKSKSNEEKLAITEKRKLTNSLKSKEQKIKTSEKLSLARKSKSNEEKTEIYNKVKQTKLERYNNENYNNIEKQKLTFNLKTDEEKLDIVKKRKKTKLEKYGNENYVNFEKAKQTKLEKYNDENYTNSKKMKATKLEKYNDENFVNPKKAKQTKLEKYGDENYNNIEKQKLTFSLKSDDELEEIKKLRKQTKLEKYGNEEYNNREKFKQTCLERYGVECNLQSNETKEKIKQTCLERYGVFNFNNSDKAKQTCLEKYNVVYFKQSHFKNINDLNEKYVKENFIKNNRFLIQEFMEYFNFEYTCAMKYKKMFNIQEPNKTNLYKTQQFIFDSIKTENKIFNDRSVLDGKELDIYLPDIKLAIEYNGLLYHSEGYSEHKQFGNVDKNYHLDKTLGCLQKGITLFHIFEGENLDLWLSMINNKLGLNERIFARKCYVAELKSKDIINFLNENHIQGYVQSSINLGLFYTDGVDLPKLVSVMTFSKPRFNKRYEYELIRFCSLKNTSVIGGANKLLKYFINKYNPKSIISYANRRFSNGSIYETLGFKKIGASAPNYFYFNMLDYKLESRNKYQKHKLKSLLSDFDSNLSEAENMFKNGYRRIYDCGNLVYELVL